MAAVPVPEAVTLAAIISPTAYITPVVPATVFQLVVPVTVILYSCPINRSEEDTLDSLGKFTNDLT